MNYLVPGVITYLKPSSSFLKGRGLLATMGICNVQEGVCTRGPWLPVKWAEIVGGVIPQFQAKLGEREKPPSETPQETCSLEAVNASFVFDVPSPHSPQPPHLPSGTSETLLFLWALQWSVPAGSAP